MSGKASGAPGIDSVVSLSRLAAYVRDPLRRNALLLMATNALAALLGFSFWILVTRSYSANEIGLATALLSVMLLLALVSRLGLDIGLIRFLPSSQSKRDLINSCLTLAGLSSAAAATIFLLGLNLWSPKLLFVREDLGYLAAFILSTVAMTVAQLQGQIFVALRSAHFTFAQSLITGARLIPVALLTGLGAIGVIASLGLGWGLALVAGSLFTVRLLRGYRPLPTIQWGVVNDIAHFSAGNYVASIFAALPLYVMPLVIIGVLSTEDSAYFYIALNVGGLLGMISGSTTFSLLAEGSHNPEMLRSQVVRASKFAALFLIPGVVVILVFGGQLLSLFGAEYARNSRDSLSLFALASIPQAICSLYITVSRVQKKIAPVIYVDAALAFLMIGMSYVLMRWVGVTGIGIAWLLAYGLVAMVVGPMMFGMAGIPARRWLPWGWLRAGT